MFFRLLRIVAICFDWMIRLLFIFMTDHEYPLIFDICYELNKLLIASWYNKINSHSLYHYIIIINNIMYHNMMMMMIMIDVCQKFYFKTIIVQCSNSKHWRSKETVVRRCFQGNWRFPRLFILIDWLLKCYKMM
jgi:hypothetical protein